MRTSRLIFAVLSIIVVGGNAGAQTDPATQLLEAAKARQPTAIVRGRAVFDDTNQPAPRQRVQLVSTRLLSNRQQSAAIPTAMTEANGAFVFNNVAPGEYYVVALPADAHAASAETSPLPRQTGTPAADTAKLEQYQRDNPRVTVTGVNAVEIELRVKNPHFGGVSGQIMDANGAPVAGAQVRAMKTGEQGFGATVTADENGVYKFRGLTAGEYIMSAAPRKQEPAAKGTPTVEGVLGDTYYPSAIDRRMAAPVVVPLDGELTDISITLISRSLHRVSGTVRAEGDGHPIAGATVRLEKKKDDQPAANEDSSGIQAAMSNYLATTDPQGNWALSNLPDGVYTILVRSGSNVAAKQERFVNKSQELTIAGSDVQDLTIEVSTGGIISGHVTVELGNGPTPAISIGVGAANTRVEPDGNFVVAGVPEGEFPLAVLIRPQNAFYAKSIELNGLDLLRTKLKVGSSENIKDVKVVVAPASILTGRVLSAAAKTPVRQVSIMLIPADPTLGPAFVRPNGTTNAAGTFTIGGAPGEYFVVLWSRGDPAPANDVESIKNLPNAVRITLAPGERKSVELIK